LRAKRKSTRIAAEKHKANSCIPSEQSTPVAFPPPPANEQLRHTVRCAQIFNRLRSRKRDVRFAVVYAS
jgi:hypothetical protein